MSYRKTIFTQADEILLTLAQIESIKDEIEKNPKQEGKEKIIEEAVSNLEKVRQSLATIRFRIQNKEFEQFTKKILVLSNFFNSCYFNDTKFADQASLSSLQNDELVSESKNQKLQSFKDSQNFKNSMSQSIVRKSEARSKSLSQKRHFKTNKNFKEPVCSLVPSDKKKIRPSSLSVFERFKSKENQEAKYKNETLPKRDLNLIPPTIPDSQSLNKNFKNLTIRIIQDEELIPIGDTFWQNLFNGKIDLYHEFKKDFDF